MGKVVDLRPAVPDSLPPTFGAARARLEENGYTPCSATWPYGVAMDVQPALVAHPPDFMIADHVAAILAQSPARKHVAALVIRDSGFADDELRTRARKVLESRGLLAGPRLLATDGSALHPLRYSAYQALEACSALGGAVTIAIGWRAGPGAPFYPVVIPLVGEWEGGDLLTVPHAQLPELIEPEALIKEIDHLAFALAEERRPAPKPSRRAWTS